MYKINIAIKKGFNKAVWKCWEETKNVQMQLASSPEVCFEKLLWKDDAQFKVK